MGLYPPAIIWGHVEQQRIFAGAVELAGNAFKLETHLRGGALGFSVGPLCSDLESVHAQRAKAPAEKPAHHPVRDNVLRVERKFSGRGVVHGQHKPAAQSAIAIEHPDCNVGENKNAFHALCYPLRHGIVVAEQQRHQI
jgi:hypothetical protein